MRMAVLMLSPFLDFEDYRVEVLRFLRGNRPARSIEVRLSADDDVRFWRKIPSDLNDTATAIARYVVGAAQGQAAAVILRGVQDSPARLSADAQTRRATSTKSPPHIMAAGQAFPITQCPACKRPTHSRELALFKGRKICLSCAEMHNRNERLRQEAKAVSSELARAMRQIAPLLDSHGCL
jgi:hypothetical protein